MDALSFQAEELPLEIETAAARGTFQLQDLVRSGRGGQSRFGGTDLGHGVKRAAVRLTVVFSGLKIGRPGRFQNGSGCGRKVVELRHHRNGGFRRELRLHEGAGGLHIALHGQHEGREGGSGGEAENHDHENDETLAHFRLRLRAEREGVTWGEGAAAASVEGTGEAEGAAGAAGIDGGRRGVAAAGRGMAAGSAAAGACSKLEKGEAPVGASTSPKGFTGPLAEPGNEGSVPEVNRGAGAVAISVAGASSDGAAGALFQGSCSGRPRPPKSPPSAGAEAPHDEATVDAEAAGRETCVEILRRGGAGNGGIFSAVKLAKGEAAFPWSADPVPNGDPKAAANVSSGSGAATAGIGPGMAAQRHFPMRGPSAPWRAAATG